MRRSRTLLSAILALVVWGVSSAALAEDAGKSGTFLLHPIGHVEKTGAATTIVLDERYEPGVLGMESGDKIWVLWWFDRNDTAEMRAILQVHPRGNPDNPLTGVFSTRSPVRPNLIALTRCTVLAVRGNVIEIDAIDAFPDTPVLDIKRAYEAER
ncbi:MAG: SAM-dependent methyltransferase [Alphaproteobacteria bacterium]|nr:SAM-dependent methyltransferase [Alphaproteobacteria bacterium]